MSITTVLVPDQELPVVLPTAPEEFIQAATRAVWQQIWRGRCRTTDDDYTDDDDEVDDISGMHGDVDDEEELVEEMNQARATGHPEDEFEAISVWDKLAESFLRAGMVSGA